MRFVSRGRSLLVRPWTANSACYYYPLHPGGRNGYRSVPVLTLHSENLLSATTVFSYRRRSIQSATRKTSPTELQFHIGHTITSRYGKRLLPGDSLTLTLNPKLLPNQTWDDSVAMRTGCARELLFWAQVHYFTYRF
jgi:hypothetical protein